MKEYLNKLTDGTYKLVVLSDVIDGHDGLIEVPEGANFAWKSDGKHVFFTALEMGYRDAAVVWQRAQHPEELPFIDDEPSLNDQYAEIEQVRKASIADTLNERQSTYGDFSMVAEMTQGLLFVMSQYGYNDMPDTHKESIHMITSKLARIINGNHNHKDSWHDIAGYATLIENL